LKVLWGFTKRGKASCYDSVGERTAVSMERRSRREARRFEKLPRKGVYLLGIAIVLGSEFILRDVLLPSQPSGFHVGMALLGEWLVFAAFIGLWIPRVEGASSTSLGWGRFKARHLWLAILAYLLTTLAIIVSDTVLVSIGLEPMRSLQPRLKGYSLPVLVGLFLTGSFLEEILYRGYLIERTTLLTGHRWLAGLVSWLSFTLVHLKFVGLGPMIDMAIMSAALTLLYLCEGNLWPCIIFHGVNNALAYLIFPLFIE